jgi:hypothetical protein
MFMNSKLLIHESFQQGVIGGKTFGPWAQAVLDNLLIDRAIGIPEEYKKVINELLEL